MLTFVWPLLFLALPLPWLVRRFLPSVNRSEPALLVPDLRPFQHSGAGQRSRRGARQALWYLILLWLAWALLVTAAARPQWQGEQVSTTLSGRDLLLAVDLSGSMNIEDMYLGNRQVTRLEAVKSVIGEFIRRRQGDRIGLVLFGTRAYVHVPLTMDTNTVMQLLQESTVGMPGPRTAIGDAIGLSVRYLRDRPGDEKVLILLTDGANNSGQLEPVRAAEIAAAENVRIHAVGVGGQPAPGSGGFLGGVRERTAEVDHESLAQIAELTGGRSYMAHNTAELEEIYLALDQIEPIDEEVRTFRQVQALTHYPLGGALLLYGVALLFPGGRLHV